MKPILLAATLLLIGFSSCRYVGGKRVKGNGNVTTQERQTPSFNGVETRGNFDLYVTTGTATSVKVEAEDNLQQYIDVYVEGDKLIVKTDEGFWLRPKRNMKIYVTSPGFNHLSLSGSGNIIGQNKITDSSRIYVGISGSGDVRLEVDAPSVEANITGSGNITLSGSTKNFSADTRGSGDIKAFDLKTEESAVDIAGSGNAEVFASVKLKVNVAGSGDVKYKGAPQVDSHVAGSGGVKKVD
ncbi:MAG: hypothetical protein RLZZ316_547 [Bacteroidota bacterium]|jgi:hypothetical protein